MNGARNGADQRAAAVSCAETADFGDVALVYDKFLVKGGGERVFDILAVTYPEAAIYALNAYPRKEWEDRYKRPIHTPPLAWLFTSRLMVILLYPLACFLMSRLTVRARTAIVYSSSCGKYVRLDVDRSILYSNYPNRGIFELEKVVTNPLLRLLASPFTRLFRTWEVRQLRKYTRIASISGASRDALKRHTGIESVVLPCPYNDKPFKQHRTRGSLRERPGDTFLIVSRLEPEKELEYAIAAFRQSPYRLRVAGSGSLLKAFKRAYFGSNIEFLGFISDDQLVAEIDDCVAVVFPSEIEYSLVPVEANALGKAVVALDSAAARELLTDWNEDRRNGTAIFYKDRTAPSVLAAARAALDIQWDQAVLQRNAVRFEPATFQASLHLFTQ